MGRIRTLAQNGALTLPLILAIAAVLRLGAVIAIGDLSPRAQLWEYGEQGLCALRHGGDLCRYHHDLYLYPSAYVPPLASYLWMILFSLFGAGALAEFAFQAVNIACDLACIGLVYKIALDLTGQRRPALIAAALLALFPTFVAVAATYETTPMALALNFGLLALCISIAKGRSRSVGAFAAAGVLATACALVRSEMLLVGPLLIALAAAWRWPDRRAVVRGMTVAALAMAVTLTPWIVRNEVVLHRFIPGAQSAGYNLWKGYSRYSEGSGHGLERTANGTRQANAIRATVPFGDDFEGRTQDAFLRATMGDVQASTPARIGHLIVNKIAMLWIFDWTDPVTRKIAYWLPWLVSSLLGLYGAGLVIRGRIILETRAASLIGIMLASLTGVYALTEVALRYRMHIEPALFIFAGLGADALLSSLAARLKSQPKAVARQEAAAL